MILATVIGAIGPVFLMTFGLVANGLANIIKLFGTMRNGFLGLGKQSNQLAFQTQYMSSEQIEAATIAASLDQAHARLIQTFTQEAGAVDALNAAYRRAISAGQNFANANPGAMLPPIRGGKTPGGLILPGYAKGKGVQIVPGNGPGNKDTELAMLAPGEAVISAPLTKKYGPLINSMIADNIPGYATSRSVAGVRAPEGTQFGHVSMRIETTVSKLLMALEKSIDATEHETNEKIRYLREVQKAGLGDKKVNVYGGLGTWQSEALNLKFGENKGRGAAPTKMVVNDIVEQGIKRWEPALAIGGAKLEDVSAELAKYDAALQESVLNFKRLDQKLIILQQMNLQN